MEKFKTFTGTICAIDRANIDTDALIPKEHLKSIKRTGFGSALFQTGAIMKMVPIIPTLS